MQTCTPLMGLILRFTFQYFTHALLLATTIAPGETINNVQGMKKFEAKT